MPKLVVILFLMFLPMPIYGQKDEPKGGQREVANPPVSYLSRLFSPDNLPNIGLLGAGIIGIIVANRTLSAIREQSKIANATLVTQFRPKVIVRGVKLNPTTSAIYDGLDDKVWKVELQITNTGGTIAYIQNCVASFSLISDVPNVPPSENWTRKWESLSLVPGERCQLELEFSSQDLRTALHVMEYAVRQRERQYTWPVCAGTITYLDGNGFKRETGFQRSWDVATQRFNASTDSDCEYTD